MRKIFTIICFALTGVCGNLWGAAEYSVGNFSEVSESTRNLLEGYVRCGSLIKPLVPTSKTPMLVAIQAIGSYNRNIAEKTKQVKDFLDGLVDTMCEDFSTECSNANPTFRLSVENAYEILAFLRRDLEVWLKEHRIFLQE